MWLPDKRRRGGRPCFTPLSAPAGDLDLWAARSSTTPAIDASCTQPERCAPNRGEQAVQTRCRNRRDQPEVLQRHRADSSCAIDAASSPASKTMALLALEKSLFAESSVASQESLLRTWERFHQAWFQGASPTYPLTTFKLRAISAMFRQGHYKSFKNYIFAAKTSHIKSGTQLVATTGPRNQRLRQSCASWTGARAPRCAFGFRFCARNHNVLGVE